MKIWGLGLAGAIAAAIGIREASAVAPPPKDTLGDAVQVLADLTAIDADCRDLAVNFGIGFDYAEQQGVPATSVMPTGARRPAFEQALRQTQTAYGAAIECGTLARHYSIDLPGSVTFQPPGRDGS